MESKVDKKVKIIFIIIDGIGELSLPSLKDLTTLEAANILYMNAIAASGLNGIMDPVETGLACGSDTAHMNIFNYNPFKLYRGRGAFESMGSGITMDNNDIAFKSNFAHMDEKTGIVKLRRVDREFHLWGLELINELNGMKIPGYKDHCVTVLHATEHRCGVKVSGPNLTDNITGTDPLKDNLLLRKAQPKDKSDLDAVFSAELINELSKAINTKLAAHPINIERQEKGLPTANIVLLRGCGSKLKVPAFQDHHGMKGFLIAPTAIINGLGQTIGLDVIKVPGTTGDYHSNLNLKGEQAAFIISDKSKDYDFGFVHVKAVDDAGHDKSIEKKIKYLEKSDEMIKTLIENLAKYKDYQSEYVICLTGDHTTPVLNGDHTFEPVPFTISTFSAISKNLNINLDKISKNELLYKLADNVKHFNELEASEGVFGRFSGCEALGIMKKFRDSVSKVLESQ